MVMKRAISPGSRPGSDGPTYHCPLKSNRVRLSEPAVMHLLNRAVMTVVVLLLLCFCTKGLSVRITWNSWKEKKQNAMRKRSMDQGLARVHLVEGPVKLRPGS